MKIFNNIVYFLITVGSNTERRKSRIDYGNMGMIIFYFIQLIGYVYSQFESKSAKFYENDYLARIGQYSSLPFIMITIHYDPFTILMFAGMFTTIVSIYVALILQIYYKSLEPSHFVNRFIKFYFQNFQWYFLTPFHECMVGVKTCGNLAYLNMYSDIENCWSQISLWFMIPSFVGQFLLILSGFLSLYCFRNYEFIQGDLMRKFTILNFLTIILHMILQMCNFWRDLYMYSDIIKHLVLILILFVHSIDSYMNLPFGYSNETIFFSKILGCSTFFEILVLIWIFSNNDDGIIFLTFSVFAPLIFVVVEAYFDRYFDQECTNYCQQKQCFNSDYIFEYLCQLSGQEFAQKDCLLILKYMQLHCQECREILCPCRQKIQKFVNGQYALNVMLIYLWIQFQFQKATKFIIENKLDYEIFESLGIKFVTFLQRYRENQILSQKIIQDILFIYQKLPKHSYPYFFLNLTKIIQNKNKVEMEIQNNSKFQISKVQFKTLNDISLLLVYEDEIINSLKNALGSQKKFWILNNRQAIDFDQLLLHSQEIYRTSQQLKETFQKFQELRQRPIQDTTLIMRIELLISLVSMEDLNATLKLARNLSKEENQSNDQLNISQFLNGSAVSIISEVSTQTLGCININDQLNQFFGYDPESQYLKTIDQLLPSKIGLIHNGLIENFLQRGNSERLNSNSEQFITNKDNFIEKVTICLNVAFPLLNDDYQFLMIAHLLKSYKYSNSDQNKRGYILVDSDFYVFGLTKNIFERLYQPNQIYENTLIFQLIPDLHQIMEQYFKIQALANFKKISRQAQICLREIGFIMAPNQSQRSTRKEESIAKYTNKHLANILKEQRKSMNINKASIKATQIEYSVLLKVLSPTINDQVKEFLYFIVEIDFQDDPLLSRQSLNVIHNSQLFKKLKEDIQITIEKSNNIILSNEENDNNEEADLIVDGSNTGSRRSQSDLVNRISKVEGQINNNSLPISLKNLILHFAFQMLLFIIVIVIISSLFKHKRDIQSDCIEQITLDLNFLDVYSLAMSGSRHIIFYRDFYPIIQDSLIIINDTIVNVSRHDKLYMAWLQLEKGLLQLIDMYQNYSQKVENSRVKLLNIYLIHYDLKSKIAQPVESFAAYYQIMLQVFYMGYQSFSSSPDVYLSGSDDSHSIQIARSIIFYNFLEVATNANSTLQDCQIYNIEENNYFDTLIVNYFIVMYLILSLQFISIIFFYYRVTKSIRQYFKLLNLCDQEDYAHAIQRCDYLINMLQYDRIILRQKQFQSLINQPANIFEDLRKTSIQSTIVGQKKQRKPELVEVHADSKLTPSLLVILLISVIQLLYVFSLQLYYSNLQNNIQPINDRALIAQQLRLNFILSVNRFDLFLIKSYFQSYNGTYLSQNIKTDTLILKQLEIKTSILEDDISTLQEINFADFLLQSSSLSELEQQQVLGGDVCQLTGCNMKSELFSEKLYQEQFSPLFYEGIVSLHAIILQFLKGSSTQVLEQDVLSKNLENILEDPIYIIYFVWGMDAIQYQISQFSQYFIDVSLKMLTQLTSYNQIIILLVGVAIIIVILVIQQMFIKFQYRKYLFSKYMIRIVPLPILFQRNIPKHLANFERRHKYF